MVSGERGISWDVIGLSLSVMGFLGSGNDLH